MPCVAGARDGRPAARISSPAPSRYKNECGFLNTNFVRMPRLLRVALVRLQPVAVRRRQPPGGVRRRFLRKSGSSTVRRLALAPVALGPLHDLHHVRVVLQRGRRGRDAVVLLRQRLVEHLLIGARPLVQHRKVVGRPRHVGAVDRARTRAAVPHARQAGQLSGAFRGRLCALSAARQTPSPPSATPVRPPPGRTARQRTACASSALASLRSRCLLL